MLPMGARVSSSHPQDTRASSQPRDVERGPHERHPDPVLGFGMQGHNAWAADVLKGSSSSSAIASADVPAQAAHGLSHPATGQPGRGPLTQDPAPVVPDLINSGSSSVPKASPEDLNLPQLVLLWVWALWAPRDPYPESLSRQDAPGTAFQGPGHSEPLGGAAPSATREASWHPRLVVEDTGNDLVVRTTPDPRAAQRFAWWSVVSGILGGVGLYMIVHLWCSSSANSEALNLVLVIFGVLLSFFCLPPFPVLVAFLVHQLMHEEITINHEGYTIAWSIWGLRTSRISGRRENVSRVHLHVQRDSSHNGPVKFSCCIVQDGKKRRRMCSRLPLEVQERVLPLLARSLAVPVGPVEVEVLTYD